MSLICADYATTGRCRQPANCPAEHQRTVTPRAPPCQVCPAAAEWTTACDHAFCASCAALFLRQSTRCLVCDRDTHGLVYPLARSPAQVDPLSLAG